MKKVDIDQFIKRSFNDRIHTHDNEDEKKYEGLTYECLLPNHDLTFCDFVSTQLRHKLLENSIFQPIDVSNLTKEEFKSLWHIGKVLCDEMENLLHQCGLDWTPSRQARYLRDFTDQELSAECNNRNISARRGVFRNWKQLQHDVLLLSNKIEKQRKAEDELRAMVHAYFNDLIQKIITDKKNDLPDGYIIEGSEVLGQIRIESKRPLQLEKYEVFLTLNGAAVKIGIWIDFLDNSELVAVMNALNEYLQDENCNRPTFEHGMLTLELDSSIEDIEKDVRSMVDTIIDYIKDKDKLQTNQ